MTRRIADPVREAVHDRALGRCEAHWDRTPPAMAGPVEGSYRCTNVGRQVHHRLPVGRDRSRVVDAADWLPGYALLCAPCHTRVHSTADRGWVEWWDYEPVRHPLLVDGALTRDVDGAARYVDGTDPLYAARWPTTEEQTDG